MRNVDPALVDKYVAQVFQAVDAIRSARGQSRGGRVSKQEFSAHSLAAVLCASGGRFLPAEDVSEAEGPR